jgi:hypothetical protein
LLKELSITIQGGLQWWQPTINFHVQILSMANGSSGRMKRDAKQTIACVAGMDRYS